MEIVRKAMTRERLTHEGEHWTLPLPDGPGKPIKLTVHPVREHIPLYIAAIGPKNLEQTGEIAEGALLVFFSPEHAEETTLGPVRAGRREGRQGAGGLRRRARPCRWPSATTSTPWPTSSAPTPRCTWAAWAAASRTSTTGSPAHGLREGGGRDPGHSTWRAKRTSAAAAVPQELIDSTTLLGGVDRIADRMRAYAEAGVTTLSLAPAGFTLEERIASLRAGVEALERAGLA